MGKAQTWLEHHAQEAVARVRQRSDDAVYIPLPPSLHKEWTIKAAEAGKHVLCEKPTAMSAIEAREMLAACRSNGVQFLDGTMWPHTPRAADMKKVIQEGRLGKLRRVVSAFSIQMSDTPEQHRYVPELGGGVLYDIGWYCIRAALWAFDAVPTHVYATATYHRGVDNNATALMWFSDNRMASFDCGYDLTRRKWMEVVVRGIWCATIFSPWDIETAFLDMTMRE